MNNKSAFAEYLEKQFLLWQQTLGRRATQVEFAAWLEVERAQLSRYMNGNKTPTRDVADRLAARLGMQVYDLLGLARPDPLIEQFIQTLTTPQERQLALEYLNFIQTLTPEDRQEFSQSLQAKIQERQSASKNVISKPRPNPATR